LLGSSQYVEKHNYVPDSIVIDALFNGKILTYDEVDGKFMRERMKEMEEEAKKRTEDHRARCAARGHKVARITR